jgi:hypothetical protein
MAGQGGQEGRRAALTYREGADGVDGELVDLSERHDGQKGDGVCEGEIAWC